MSNLNVPQTLKNAIERHRAGDLKQAEILYRQILQQEPYHADATHLLGYLAYQAGHLDAAVEIIGRAIAIKPAPEYHSNLGNVLKSQGRFDEAIAVYRKAIALRSDYAEAYRNLGNVLKDTGQLDAAITAYRTAIALKPDDAAAHSNLVYSLHFHPDYDTSAIYQEHSRWNQAHAQPLTKTIELHKNDPSPIRRLKIGYVSPDFRGHIVGLCVLPLLEQHDHQQFEIFCYADVLRPDSTTEKLRSCADHWHSILGHSDPQVAQRIREDQIDILIDLTAHTAKNRLLVFARKPAPIQVTYLGCPSTTGLTAIDYRLSDPYLDPPQTHSGYTEQTVRLPDTHLCWRWDGQDAQISPLPASKNGYITFGCLNNFCKVTAGALDVWGKILSTIHGSRLILRSPEGSGAQWAREHLVRHGITDDRLQLVDRLPRDQYVGLYHQHDIGLDPFPYPGHTTTCDSLWMGVPVVTLSGITTVGRIGVSMLSNVGLQELVAQTPETYIKVAKSLAQDIPRLREMRAGLRQRMRQSPLMDAPRFAKNVEAEYRQMWRKWCDRK